MRPFLIALLAVVLTLVGLKVGGFLTTGATTEVKKETAYERIMRTGVIRCGYLVWEPAFIRDPNTGAFSGPIYDFTEELGRMLGLKIEWSLEMSTATYLEDLNAGKYDLECSGGFANAHRGKFVLYSQPFAYIPAYLYVRADDNRFNESLSAINKPEVTFSVMDGDYSEHYRKSTFPQSNVLQLPPSAPFSEQITSVIYKKADVAVYDALSVQPILDANPGKMKALSQLVRTVPLSYSVPQNDLSLKAMIDTATDEIVDAGFVDAMIRKYNLAGALLPVAKPYENAK